MLSLKSLFPCLTILALLATCGCQEAPAPTTNATEDATTTDMGDDHGEAPELSEEDQALADAQKYCPVGGELGSMGNPVKVMVGDKPVFICCEHCRKPLLEDPDKYMAALEEKLAKDAEAENTEGGEGLAAPGPADDAS